MKTTNVVLIPNEKNPNNTGDLRFIFLCNVLYKIISAIIVNRLKVILPGVISENQNGFLKDRLI